AQGCTFRLRLVSSTPSRSVRRCLGLGGTLAKIGHEPWHRAAFDRATPFPIEPGLAVLGRRTAPHASNPAPSSSRPHSSVRERQWPLVAPIWRAFGFICTGKHPRNGPHPR